MNEPRAETFAEVEQSIVTRLAEETEPEQVRLLLKLYTLVRENPELLDVLED